MQCLFKAKFLKYKYIMEKLTSTKLTPEVAQNLSDMAHKLRIHSINMTDISGSG